MTLSAAPVNVAFIDGGSRGNPGPSASAFALSIDGQHVVTKAKYIGHATNNVAEYRALELLVGHLVAHPKVHQGRRIDILSDSELLVNQMNRKWLVKDQNISRIKAQAELKINAAFMWLRFHYIPRSKNTEADKAVNLMLDTPQMFPTVIGWVAPVTCSRDDWKAAHLDRLIDTEKKGA